MKLVWSFLCIGCSVFLLMLGSCKSILSGGSKIQVYEEVVTEIMPSDPLLFHFYSTEEVVNQDDNRSVHSSELTYSEISEKADALLSKANECRVKKESFDTDLESVIFYLEHILNRESFTNHHYPVASDHGLHLDVLSHFSSRSLSTKKEVESFLDELRVMDQRFKELIDELELRRKNGFVAPSNILKSLRVTCDSIVLIPINDNPIYSTYSQKLNSIGLMEPSKKDAYVESCKEVLLESVIPAYVRLSNYLAQLEETSLSVVGVWRFPRGDEFYQHCLNWHTGFNLSVDSMYTIAKSELGQMEESGTKTEELDLEFSMTNSSPHQFRKVLPTKAHQLGYKLYVMLENELGYEENRLATVKLIVDIGIHQKRWLREQAIQYLTSNTKIDLEYAQRIVDQSISNPGMIGSEKIGQLVLQNLRNENSNLSDDEFRKEITQHGPLPLGTLSRVISVNKELAVSR